MKNSFLTILLFCGIVLPIMADDVPFITGKITPDEMNLAFYLEKYSGEPAIILGDFADCRFGYNEKSGFQYEYVRQIRIIVMNEAGLDYGDFPISFYETSAASEKIDKFKAWVHNLEDGKVSSVRVRQKDGFERNRENNWKQLVFAMPGVKAGSVIDITYRITSDFLFQLRDWQFQYEIPVLHSEYRLNLPSFYVYRARYNGSFNLDKIEQTEGLDRWTIPHKTPSAYGMVDAGDLMVTAKSAKFRWVAYNVKPLKPEPFMDNVHNYQARMIFEYVNEQFPDSEPKNYTNTWEDISKYLAKHDDFGKYLSSFHTVKSTLMPSHELVSNADRIRYAMETISGKVKWNDDSSLFTDHPPSKVLELGAGNSAEINLLLVALLREMGLKAYPVLATTVRNGILTGDSPTLTQWNYVVAAVSIGTDQMIVVDATVHKPIAGFVPQRLLNGDGRIMDTLLNSWISIDQNTEIKKEAVYDLKLNDAGDLSGTITLKIGGYGKYLFLQNENADEAKAFWKDYLSNENVEISDEVVNYDDFSNGPVQLSAHIHIPNYAQRIGNELIIKSLLFDARDENLLQAPERMYPIHFKNTQNSTTTYNIELPENMKLEFIPDEINGRWGRWNHKLLVTETENGYSVFWNDIRGQRVIPAQNYAAFRNYYSKKIEDNLQSLIIKIK